MDLITSRAVKGEFLRALEVERPPEWFGLVANQFFSDQGSETYPLLSATPAMREWVGGRNAKGFTESSIVIPNKHFEDTLDVSIDDMRRDKFDFILAGVEDLSARAIAHPASLVSTLIDNGETGICYDGQYFFSASHAEGDSGTQSNDISVTIASLPAAVHGTTTAPSVEEMQGAIAAGIAQIMSFKDSAGKPINQGASQFLVMAPVSFFNTVFQAVATNQQIAASQTALTALKSKFRIDAEVNLDLTWTTKIAIFRTDARIKAFASQRETAVKYSQKAEGSDYAHDNYRYQYGLDYHGNAAYALWQRACLVTLT